MTNNILPLSVIALILATVVPTGCLVSPPASPSVPGADEEVVVVPAEDVRDFAVSGVGTLFRIPLMTISGGNIEGPEIQGEAEAVRTNNIQTVGKGGTPLIGAKNMEYVFRGKQAGDVTIRFTIKSPASPDPQVVTYQVAIKESP